MDAQQKDKLTEGRHAYICAALDHGYGHVYSYLFLSDGYVNMGNLKTSCQVGHAGDPVHHDELKNPAARSYADRIEYEHTDGFTTHRLEEALKVFRRLDKTKQARADAGQYEVPHATFVLDAIDAAKIQFVFIGQGPGQRTPNKRDCRVLNMRSTVDRDQLAAQIQDWITMLWERTTPLSFREGLKAA